ncbi:MAG: septal ring lytic transglycosylase RlpA family protein [Holosporales bacterium]|jgi:rare lipoprotein A (peptidoglycan hydrolase)|nr:septal ring lytic transglycosylase RlpA family protein [Holosporales bacterium]
MFYEYDEVGLASWYGDDFHGKMKATGERFNKMAMTAAHRTLPLPSVVRVTNLRNGKSVIVIIDDRGPYCYAGRIIDLSYGAARALNLHRHKPSPVRVQTMVADSVKLSRYIATHCKKRRDPFGRTWAQLYFQEILGSNPKRYTEYSSMYKTVRTNQKSGPYGIKRSIPKRLNTF